MLGWSKEKLFSFSPFLDYFIHKSAFPSNLGTRQELHCKWGSETVLGRSSSLPESAKES